MNQLFFLLLFLLSSFCYVASGQTDPQRGLSDFQPSVGVVLGVMALMLALTFILLVYTKFCYRGTGAAVHHNLQFPDGLLRRSSRFSGIDKTVIESLPFFKFSSLRGSREGMECAVCLSKFEDIEILRLLPKCKHAFHIACVDQWLENHSSCPLCRHTISVEDLTYSNSLRFLSNRSEVRDDSNVELFVQREENLDGSSRFSFRSSFRKSGKGVVIKEEKLPIREEFDGVEENDKVFHKFNHKIIMSDVVLKRRWSNLSSSDLMLLNSEMLGDVSSNRFSRENLTTWAIEDDGIMKIKEDMETKRDFESKIGTNTANPRGVLNQNENRSMSDITVVSRFKEFDMRKSFKESSVPAGKDERLKRVWLPIARRTVQWYANRDHEESNNPRPSLNV